MMNRNLETFDADVTLSLDDTPLPLHLPVGAAIFAMRGKVWITQERLRDDIVLSAGERFDVKGTELILVSAIKGSATIHVVPASETSLNGARDMHDFFRARAGRLRAEEAGHIASHISNGIAAWIARARGVMTARPRALGH
jgi:hypothetical protein